MIQKFLMLEEEASRRDGRVENVFLFSLMHSRLKKKFNNYRKFRIWGSYADSFICNKFVIFQLSIPLVFVFYFYLNDFYFFS